MAEKNTEVKETTRQFIETLLDSFHIDINYKDDIFLEQSSSYKHLISSNLGSRNKTSPKYNPNHKVLYDEKRKLTFADVKYDFASKGQKDLLKDLEGRYIESKIGDAWAANENLPNSSMDAIADAVVKFMYEVDDVKRKKRKNVTATCLDKVDKNMCLVYKDGKSTPYQFPSLEKVLEVIAEETVNYCNSLTEIKNKSRDGNKREHVTPLFIRKTCVLVCYTLLDFGNYVSVKTQKKPLSAITGVSKQIMADLHKRCSDLGYPYFTKENKLFQSDKWAMSPDKLLRKDSYVAPLSPISYAGLKQGYLGFMIRELQSQVPHKTFLDAFGGSGISIVQFPHEDGVNYYVNDFHYANVCYYKMLKSSEAEFDSFLDCLEDIRVAVEIAVENDRNHIWTREEFNDAIGKLYNIYDTVADVCINDKYKNYIKYNGVCFDFLKIMQHINPEIKSIGYKDDTIIAAIFTAFTNMTVNGSISRNVIGNTGKFVKKNRNIFKRDFSGLRECYRDVAIANPIGASAMDLLVDKKYNSIETLVYLDSPYIGTMEYSASKESGDKKYDKGTIIEADGKDFISNDFDMKSLLDKCDSFLGKFIFSCRLNMPNPEPVAVVTGDGHREDRGSLTLNDIYQHFNNYLWFFKRWLSMGNIDDCYVLFMADTSWSVLDEFLYYDPNRALLPHHARPVDEAFKEKFVSSDWGMEVDNTTKERIFEYLRAIILVGHNFEIMITNFDFKEPIFDNMFEHINNIFEKQTVTLRKMKNAKGEKSTDKNVEMLIPDDGMFVKLPMKLLAEFVINQFRDISRDFKIK